MLDVLLLPKNLFQFIVGWDILYFENFDIDPVVTPVNVNAYKQLLLETDYDQQETKFLTN